MSTRPKNRMGDDLERFIKLIGDCKSKSEEDRILFRAIESTKSSVKSGKVDKQKTRDLMIRLLYFEMLGHDASFGHFLAVQACGSSSVTTKLIGYLAVSQFLQSSDSLILLLVNTWMSDLQNDNHIIVCATLTAVSKLVNADAIGALVPQVVTLTAHAKEGVRKKAVMALHRFCQIDPRCEGGMAGIDVHHTLRHMLCDKDPSVMAASLCAIQELAKHDPYPYRNLIPSITSILKQIIDRRLSKTYEYHHCPAPFIQMHLLRLMALLGQGDKPSTDNMRVILISVIKHANARNNIGFAVLFECIRTITTISPDNALLDAAAKSIFTFLRPENNHNLRYMGLDALGGIVSINFRQAQEHQAAVLDCLEDPDDTLKLKTLELLYKMTKASNVEIVAEKLIQYLKTCTDEHITNDICGKVSDLAERYAPSTLWYLNTMIEMFEAAGETIPSNVGHNLMKLVAEQDEDLQRSAVEMCLTLIGKPKLPPTLLQVICWILGEYGTLTGQIGETATTLHGLQEKMCELVQTVNPDDKLQGYILTALLKLSATCPKGISGEAEELLRKSLTSKSTDLQQRALELQSLMSGGRNTAMAALPFDASCEDLGDQISELQSLSFLDAYVQEAVANGAEEYIPENERDEYVPMPTGDVSVGGGLRYDAYEIPSNLQNPTPVEEQPTMGFSEVPAAAAAPVAVSNSLSLPVSSQRWGPSQPEIPSEPPVIHLENVGKLEYSHPIEPDIEEALPPERSNGTQDISDRDLLSASLFGDRTPHSAKHSKRTAEKGFARQERRTKSVSAQPKKSEPLPEIDLLDLSDPNDAASKPVQTTADPFAGIDLLSGGANGIESTASTTTDPAASTAPAQIQQPLAIDLDALYGAPQTGAVNPIAPVHPAPAVLTPPMGMTPGFGLKTGMAATTMPNISKPTTSTKDDPFKDLLG